mmetsp:Transcript_27423/g.86927  ORF Transcript_27423/g.86927 Transcript_27423/m.86927 type:complete len:205 (+) Transcript_27423:1233-1847(+)
MTRKGTLGRSLSPNLALQRCRSRTIRSAMSWKSVLPEGMPMSYMPFGPEKPRRVPCPPPSTTAATFPALSASKPAVSQATTSSGVASPRCATASTGWSLPPPPRPTPPKAELKKLDTLDVKLAGLALRADVPVVASKMSTAPAMSMDSSCSVSLDTSSSDASPASRNSRRWVCPAASSCVQQRSKGFQVKGSRRAVGWGLSGSR